MTFCGLLKPFAQLLQETTLPVTKVFSRVFAPNTRGLLLDILPIVSILKGVTFTTKKNDLALLQL